MTILVILFAIFVLWYAINPNSCVAAGGVFLCTMGVIVGSVIGMAIKAGV